MEYNEELINALNLYAFTMSTESWEVYRRTHSDWPRVQTAIAAIVETTKLIVTMPTRTVYDDFRDILLKNFTGTTYANQEALRVFPSPDLVMATSRSALGHGDVLRIRVTPAERLSEAAELLRKVEGLNVRHIAESAVFVVLTKEPPRDTCEICEHNSIKDCRYCALSCAPNPEAFARHELVAALRNEPPTAGEVAREAVAQTRETLGVEFTGLFDEFFGKGMT